MDDEINKNLLIAEQHPFQLDEKVYFYSIKYKLILKRVTSLLNTCIDQ